MGNVRNIKKIVGKSEGKRPLGRPRRRWKDSTNSLSQSSKPLIPKPAIGYDRETVP
jgi:hypothetical protein